MSFAIEIQNIAEFKLISITNTASQEKIDIATKGGLLNSWILQPKAGSFDIIDGNDFKAGWKDFESNGFKGGKMTPFSCRLENGKFVHESKVYVIDKFYLGAHALHGLLYDALFEIKHIEHNDKAATVMLYHEYQKNDNGFPFQFSVELKWTFWKENKVSICTTITNLDSTTFPMMDGWHPYFKLGKNIDECTLQFYNQGLLEYDDSLIPTGNILPNIEYEQPKSLDNVLLDNGYVLDKSKPSCTLENDAFQLMVTPDANYPYLQLYTPGNRNSIAIENLSAAPNCFNNKMGLHIMQPQEVWCLETQYQLFYKNL